MFGILASSSDDVSGGAAVGILLVLFAFAILVIAAMWKVFTKAGEAGWKSIIPILNAYVLIKIAGRPGWWVVLYLIPIVNFVIMIIVMIDLAKSFGKGTGFGLGLVFLPMIFLMILGFGSATYIGPGGVPAARMGGAPGGFTPPPPPPPAI